MQSRWWLYGGYNELSAIRLATGYLQYMQTVAVGDPDILFTETL